jgi:hypothetical protein
MSARVNAYLVVLEGDIHEDDGAATLAAIRRLRGVLDVVPHAASVDEAIAEVRVKHALGKQIWDLLYAAST